MSDLSKEEIGRYGRQLILAEFGVRGQKLLRAARVLVVGCGGLGCPAAMYLAAAGIGKLGLLDHDTVEVNNLHRQILHKEKAVGTAKCGSAAESCQALNSLPEYCLHHVVLDNSNALEIICNYDVVLDCTDNVATRYLLNDACILLDKVLVSGAALRYEGQLSVYHYKDGPCFRCLFPAPPPADTVTSCAEGGVLGVVPGVIGVMQAQEAIKVISGTGDVLCGRMFIYDALSFSARTIQLRKRVVTCSACGDYPTITGLIDYVQFCGASHHDKTMGLNVLPRDQRISAAQYKEMLDGDSPHTLIDTRPPHELEICALPNSQNIPLAKLLSLNADHLLPMVVGAHKPTKIVCICHHGNDSQIAAKHLMETLSKHSLSIVDVIGGLDMWSKLIDQNFPQY